MSRLGCGSHGGAGSQRVAAGEQDGPRGVAEEQHRIDVRAVSSYAEVQRTRRGMTANVDESDLLPDRHRVPRVERRPEWFEGADEAAVVLDGQERPVHDGPAESHSAICGGRDHRVDRGVHVDSTMTGAVLVRRSAKRLDDLSIPGERPAPAR